MKFGDALKQIIFAIIFLACIAVFSTNLPFSPVFIYHGNHEYFTKQLLKENEIRIQESKQYLKRFRNESRLSQGEKGRSDYDLVILIITMIPVTSMDKTKSITRQNFLPQTLAAALKETNHSQSNIFGSSMVTLCDVNRHQSMNILSKKYSEFIRTFSAGSKNVSSDVYRKEKEDYKFCLEQVYHNFKPKYVLMLEDDVIMKRGSLSTMTYILNSIRHLHNESDWISLKLYHPKKWLGYSNEPFCVLELLATSLIMGPILSLILKIFKYFHSSLSFLVFCIFLSLISCWLLGRQNVMKWRSYFNFTHILSKADGCCTQAVLFNHLHIPILLEYLSVVTGSQEMPVDLIIDEFASTYDLKQFMVQPSPCQHIGFLSTLGKDTHQAIDFL